MSTGTIGALLSRALSAATESTNSQTKIKPNTPHSAYHVARPSVRLTSSQGKDRDVTYAPSEKIRAQRWVVIYLARAVLYSADRARAAGRVGADLTGVRRSAFRG
ncbi:hypothetical protein EVAR_500_1 [Eumeta japonica]|uniref:Uncharacterized protein n=1 Tax=Eumeta variegata TaxID=151549 RepID=A0A4C1SBI2_EUMVA|nr:hypothetical protein EVAR_500_1 [Eumeta japonica]